MKEFLIAMSCLVSLKVLANEPMICKNTDEINFTWEWCAPNHFSNTSKTLKEVCHGYVTYKDIEYWAIKIIYNDIPDEECLFSDDFVPAALAGCSSSAAGLYTSVYGNPLSTMIVDCRPSPDMTVKYLRGRSLRGVFFEAEKNSLRVKM